MKGVVVTPELDISIKSFDAPLYRTVGKAVGGYIEHVKPMGLKQPFCMIVNEEGRIKGLPLNPVGSVLYGIQHHGQPIVGTIVIMKDGFTNGEPDIVGLEDDEAEYIFNEFKQAIKPLEMAKGAEK